MMRKKLTVGTVDPVLYAIVLNQFGIVARVRITESIVTSKCFVLFIYEADDETERRLDETFFELKKNSK